jgi:hypothetical protein
MLSKFPIGSRVGARVEMHNGGGGKPTAVEVPMRVLGYEGLKFVIAQALQDAGNWKKGHVTVLPVKSLMPREEVKHIEGEPEDENGQAIGWMEMGGLSIALTRAGDGAVQVSLERAPDYPEEYPVTVRVSLMNGEDLWEGDLS